MSTAAEPKLADKPADETPKPGKAATSFLERFTGVKAKADATPPEKPKEEEKPKEDDKAKKPEDDKGKETPLDKKPEKPKEEKPKAVVQLAPPPIDAETIAEAAGRGAAAAMAKAKEADKPKAPDIADGLDDEERENYDVLLRMEKDFGTAYKGKAAKYAESLKKSDEYQANWEKENPGREFDADAEEHNAFREANQVDWNPNHFTRTLARMEADKIVEKDREKTRAKDEERDRKEKLRDEEPKIQIHKKAVTKNYFKQLGVEFDKVVSENGQVDHAEIKRIVESDPIKRIAFEAADSVEAFTGAMYVLANNLEPYNDKNQAHKFVGEFWEQQEVLMKGQPPEHQRNEKGQMFATSDEWAAMSPARRLHFWVLTPDDLNAMYASVQSKHVQERIAAEEQYVLKAAAARGSVKKEEPKKEEPTPAPKKEDAQPPANEKPVSPAGTLAPTLAPPAQANGQSKTSTFIQRFTGKA